MTEGTNRFLVCNCEKTMAPDGRALAKALGLDELAIHTQLCRSGVAAYEGALEDGAPLCVACTQESPLFAEIAGEAGKPVPRFVNIRETAGWTKDKASATPKMAALLAAAALSVHAARLKTIESDGLCLVLGSGQSALDAAALLNRNLSATLVLEDASGIVLPSVLDFPLFAGRIASATGSLGAFEVTVDGYAPMLPSSRGEPQFAMARDGAKSRCSVIFDMRGGTPLFPRAETRDGYFRCDPGDPAAVMRAVFEAGDYAGTFEKPIYVRYDASICAHERSRKTGCTKCLDNCPASAITPDRDIVVIDNGICGGCGNCAAHCPTGAVSYDYPPRGDTIARVQVLAKTFLDAGGKAPVLLLHDTGHGLPLISAIARFGRGLPAHVIPMETHSISGIGHDVMAAALAAGFRAIAVLADPRKSDELGALREEIALTDALLDGFNLGNGRVHVIEAADPDAAEEALWSLKPAKEIASKAFTPVGGKREVARTAIGLLAEAGKRADEIIALPASAPYGAVTVDTKACTLCMACVSACPADALRDNPDRPQLRLVESACVQCGICKATCPESAIALEPRYNLAPSAMQPSILNEDEPAECIRCHKPFVARGMLNRVAEKLGGKHWMFQDEERQKLLLMCDSCRLEVLSEGGQDPFAIANRPRTRTTEDYIAAKKKGLSVEDFFSEE